MKVGDLPALVTAAKADWLPSDAWMGFSPQGKGPDAKGKCEAAIKKQFGNGYVLERVTTNFGEPCAGYEDDPRVKKEREYHAEVSDSLVHIHKLKPSALPLRDIIGDEEFEWLQDAWSKSDDRARWSVAFPIVERYAIVGSPKAKEIFSPEVWSRVFHNQSSTLRLLDDEARAQIANLEIIQVDAPNAIIAIDQEIVAAELSELEERFLDDFEEDLAGAMEGETGERKSKVKKRAAWLANKFVAQRKKAGMLTCDQCNFDPKFVAGLHTKDLRTCLDVHHKDPLAEGKRRTTTEDFSLLCPRCHRIEHIFLRRLAES